jgi:basic membrane lipoprotein Med (substrate-binding protein (PBP1-ABC) superfamily)
VAGRGLAALVVVLAVLTACRSGEPTPAPSPSPTTVSPAPAPSTGLRVAVVLPPASGRTPTELAAIRSDLDAVRQRHASDVASLRVVQPDTPGFVVDVTTLVADREADLVCVLGAGSGEVVLELAAAFPTTEFCAAPAAAEPADIPENVLLIDVRVEEIAYLAGVAAQLSVGEAAPGFVGGESQYAVDRQRAAYVAGINSVAEEQVTPYVGFPAVDEERAYELARTQYAAGVETIFSVAGPGDLGVRRAAREAVRLVIGSRRTLVDGGEEPSPLVLLTTDVDLTVPVELALARALGTWQGGRATVGLTEDALLVGPGGSDRYRVVAGPVEQAMERIRTGELRPLGAG